MDALKLILVALIWTAAALATADAIGADPKADYVGMGRYSCRGDSYKCAQINEQNERATDRQRRQYEEEQRRADEYVRRSRLREEEIRRQYQQQ